MLMLKKLLTPLKLEPEEENLETEDTEPEEDHLLSIKVQMSH
jgi:hypothetical protein